MADIIKTLSTLHRQVKQLVEEKQRDIADLRRLIHSMASEKQKLQQQVAHNHQLAENSSQVVLLRQAHLFAQRQQHEIDDISTAIHDAEALEQEKLAQLATLFAEEKRYATLLERRLHEQRREKLKKEQAQLDDVASTRRNYP